MKLGIITDTHYNFKKANLLPIVFSIVFLSVINQPTSTRTMVMSIIIFIIYIGGAIVLYLFKSFCTLEIEFKFSLNIKL